jgi:hypothetical protein
MSLLTLKKGEVKSFLLFFIAIVWLGFLVFFFQLNNPYIYPDSFLYIAITKTLNFFSLTGNFNGYQYSTDYLTLLKPGASLYVFFISFLGPFISIFHLLLLIGATYFLWSACKDKISRFSLFFILSLLVINGNVIYWLGRFGTETVTIFLASLVIYFTLRKQQTFLIIIAVLLLLSIRPEFIVLAPLLFALREFNKIQILTATAYIFLFALPVAVVTGEYSEFLFKVLLPFVVVAGFVVIYYKFKDKIESFVNKHQHILGYIFLGLFVYYIGQLFYKNIVDPNFKLTYSAVSIVIIIMLPLIITFVASLFVKVTQENIRLRLFSLFIILGLYVIYSQKTLDNYRYFINVVPFMLFSIILVIDEIIAFVKQGALLVTLFYVLFLGLLYLVLPLSILRTNYWIDRITTITDDKSYTIYSSTPFVTANAGYNSKDICKEQNFSALSKTIYILDGFVEETCPEAAKKVKTLFSEYRKHRYVAEGDVELGRYTSKNEVSEFYVIE